MRVIVTKTEEYIFDHTHDLETIKEMFENPNMCHAYRDVSCIGGSTKIISIKVWQPKEVGAKYCEICSTRLTPKEVARLGDICIECGFVELTPDQIKEVDES